MDLQFDVLEGICVNSGDGGDGC